MEKLLKIQKELKAPKGQFNSFGKYKYRSCEDIIESVKPLLDKYNCILTMSDEIVYIGNRYYIKAKTRIQEIGTNYYEETFGYAREEETKKGMDGSQITGASSSYARKYALNGLFAIDDNKDSDSTNEHKEKEEVIKPLFDYKKLESLKKWSEGKQKGEIMQYMLKIQKDYEISDDIKNELEIFINNLI